MPPHKKIFHPGIVLEKVRTRDFLWAICNYVDYMLTRRMLTEKTCFVSSSATNMREFRQQVPPIPRSLAQSCASVVFSLGRIQSILDCAFLY